MQISLRPHHLLCLKGYRGFNYNTTHKTNWGLISNLLKEYPEADILIVKGQDDLCKKCPAQLINKQSRCRETAVDNLDSNVQNLLKLAAGKIYKYGDIMKDLESQMTQEQHRTWCSFCAWWKKGLCKDSFKK